ncbi:MAG: putative metal-binding motif-containing protein [Myxococcota bacterium]
MSITLLLAFLACTSDKDVVSGEEGDTDTDTDADTDTDTDTDADCEASLEVVLPDATTIALGCTGATAEASLQFDPEAPPAVRSLGVRIGGGESTAADCYLDFDLTGVCGVGWYTLDGAASGAVATLDCAGVADEIDRIYPLAAGSIYLSEVSGGAEPDAPGGPNDLRAVGTISARSSDGLLISGSFVIDQEVFAIAVEGGECLVEETDPGLADLDFDGWEGSAGTGEDCDDADAAVHPGAYDRPDDGLDTDCDGADRTFDGVVVDAGETTTTELGYVTAEGAVGLDISLVLDTTCSMGGSIMTLDVPTIAAATTGAGDARWAFATFDDYRGAGKPFTLRAQSSDDLAGVQAAIDTTSTGSGTVGSEAGMEALYQALTGAGYDQDCDGFYDSPTDVTESVNMIETTNSKLL